MLKPARVADLFFERVQGALYCFSQYKQKIPAEINQQGFFIAKQDKPDHGWQIRCTLPKPTSYRQEQGLGLYI